MHAAILVLQLGSRYLVPSTSYQVAGRKNNMKIFTSQKFRYIEDALHRIALHGIENTLHGRKVAWR